MTSGVHIDVSLVTCNIDYVSSPFTASGINGTNFFSYLVFSYYECYDACVLLI